MRSLSPAGARMHGGKVSEENSSSPSPSGIASSEEAAAESPQMVARVKREPVAKCLTCPLCHKLLRDATTISTCLHTFCRKCILEKLNEEDNCPICNIDLGCVPAEKLRPDHNLQDLRAKIFPYKRIKVEAPEVLSTISIPVKRKERSLSSLVVTTPRIGSQTGWTGRRTKTSRKAAGLCRLSPVIGSTIKKQLETVADCEGNLIFSETPAKMTFIRRKLRNSSQEESSSNSVPTRNQDDNEESLVDESELWKPLNCLVEAANRKIALTSSTQGPFIKVEPVTGPDNIVHNREGNTMVNLNDKNVTVSLPLVRRRARKSHANSSKREEPEVSAQALIDASATRNEMRLTPLWFYLVASTDMEGTAPLPQITSHYLRIKDGNQPVSLIQKYLAQKLNLENEDELEILCCGRQLNSTLALNDLVDIWPPAASLQRVQTHVGASAKDFVIYLSYCRKVLPT